MKTEKKRHWQYRLAILLVVSGLVAPGGCRSTQNEADVCLPSSGQITDVRKRPVIIDTDVGPDDFIAIPFLLRTPSVNVKAITIIATGEAHAAFGIRNVQRMLDLTGNSNIAVTCGSRTPLSGDHAFPAGLRASADIMEGMFPESATPPPTNQSAVELLTEVIRNSPEKVTIVELGPMTNLAEAFRADPSLIDNLEMIYAMGGALDVPGNLNIPGFRTNDRGAEWNIYIDPRAAEFVFRSGAPITLVPLDATKGLPLTMDFVRKFEALGRTTTEADIVQRLLVRMERIIKTGDLYFWDPFAAAVSADESLAIMEYKKLIVVEEKGPDSGRTILSGDGSRIRVCVGADRERFEKLLVNTLTKPN